MNIIKKIIIVAIASAAAYKLNSKFNFVKLPTFSFSSSATSGDEPLTLEAEAVPPSTNDQQ